MRVLVVSNTAEACGVAEYGRMCVESLRQRGHLVDTWDSWGDCPVDTYDVAHVNWHPTTLNPDMSWGVARQGVRSLFLHDLPPWSDCPLWDRADVRFATEYCAGTIKLPYPAVDVPAGAWAIRPVTIGWTGVRGDGRDALVALAEKRGWEVNLPEGWLGTRDEISRLSSSTLNVLWYFASGRGQSLALMTAAAARRPLLLNNSAMFETAWKYQDEIYRAGWDPVVPYLEQAIDAVLDEIWKGKAKVPDRIVTDYSWSVAARRMEDAWLSAMA